MFVSDQIEMLVLFQKIDVTTGILLNVERDLLI